VGVDQTGHRDLAGAVDDDGIRGVGADADAFDLSITDHDVSAFHVADGGIHGNDVRALDDRT
jgi:hypothetical protein